MSVCLAYSPARPQPRGIFANRLLQLEKNSVQRSGSGDQNARGDDEAAAQDDLEGRAHKIPPPPSQLLTLGSLVQTNPGCTLQ
jgi:hypothetical protein